MSPSASLIFSGGRTSRRKDDVRTLLVRTIAKCWSRTARLADGESCTDEIRFLSRYYGSLIPFYDANRYVASNTRTGTTPIHLPTQTNDESSNSFQLIHQPTNNNNQQRAIIHVCTLVTDPFMPSSFSRISKHHTLYSLARAKVI